MCCGFLALVLLGPRFFGGLWWLFQPLRWQEAFNNLFGGGLWWLWPMLGLVFLPWTTIMFVLVAPLGFVEDGTHYGLLAPAPAQPGTVHALLLKWLLATAVASTR